jgi:glycosyltransferase involved in cell wall biosynthesis
MNLISILTVVYNAEDYILRCYKNILDQNFQNWEWIVVNDGSIDSTLKKLLSIDDNRLKIFSYDNNQGRGYARNLGISNCNGEWVAIFDVDDIHFPDKLEVLNNKINENNIDYFCSYAVLVNNLLEIKGYRGFTAENGIFPRGFVHPTFACKTELLKSIQYSINAGRGGPGEDARVLWIFSRKFKGYWYNDALTVYQEDREINVRKSFFSNLGHLTTLIDLLKEGYFALNMQLMVVLFKYIFKLIILSLFLIFPNMYIYTVKYRFNGFLEEGWKLSDDKIHYLNKFRGCHF